MTAGMLAAYYGRNCDSGKLFKNRLLKVTWDKEADAVADGIDKVHMDNIFILQY